MCVCVCVCVLYTIPISILVLCYDRRETTTNYANALLFNPIFIRGTLRWTRFQAFPYEGTRALVLRAHV